LLLFAPQHTRALGERIAESLGVTLATSEEREFDGGEHKMRAVTEVCGRDVCVIQSLNGDAGASANDKLCRLLFFIGALKDAGAKTVTACVPYLCYARKDRRTKANDPITTRYVAALFEAIGADRVIVVDIHNEAAFDNAFRCVTGRVSGADIFIDPVVTRLDSTPCVVASPDVGGIKRAQLLREALASKSKRTVGFAFMEKRRVEGVVSGEAFIGDVAGADVIIHDDMIASGGTIARATRAARLAGARKVLVAATHAVFMPAALQLFGPGGPDEVLVSDSVALSPAFAALSNRVLQVCPSGPAIAAMIRKLSARQ
jgi:ribose-phosphate pyrophosphokinase